MDAKARWLLPDFADAQSGLRAGNLRENAAATRIMAGLKQTIIRGGLESLYFSGAHVALKPLVGGVGVILTLHHVRPPRPGRFQPNHLLEVTPHFLPRVINYLRRAQLDLVSIDEMHRRLTER